MKKRFDEVGSPGRGVVRAKTGSLNRVITLAGTVTTKDQVFLSFAVFTFRVHGPIYLPILASATICEARVSAAINS